MTEREILRQRANSVRNSPGRGIVEVPADYLLDLLNSVEKAEGDAEHFKARLRRARASRTNRLMTVPAGI